MSGVERHCYAMAGAAALVFAILVVSFVFLPLVFIIFIPSPQLINDYQEGLAKVKDVFLGLALMIALSFICAPIDRR
jgi:uncharacterized membrane protein YccC